MENEMSTQQLAYGTSEDVEELTDRQPTYGLWAMPVAVSLLVTVAVVAAYSVGPSQTGHKLQGLNYGVSPPSIPVEADGARHAVQGYNALTAGQLVCDRTTKDYLSYLPSWDSEFSTNEEFYNACYQSLRCCTTTGNGNGCYVSDSFGPLCRGCLANHPPKMVKEPCAKFVEECGDKSEGCGVHEDETWGVNDLMNDKGVPKTTKPEWAVTFNNIDTCWNQFGSRDKRVKAYADKCWDVISWCQGGAKVCARDGKTAGHVYCKHCMMMGFDQHWDPDAEPLEPAEPEPEPGLLPTPSPTPTPTPTPTPSPTPDEPPTYEVVSGDEPFTVIAGQCVSVSGEVNCVNDIDVDANQLMVTTADNSTPTEMRATDPNLTHGVSCGELACDWSRRRR